MYILDYLMEEFEKEEDKFNDLYVKVIEEETGEEIYVMKGFEDLVND